MVTNRTCALLVAIACSACFVDRKSDALACSKTTDCTAPRVCEGGYCVIDPNACPTQCASCDMNQTPHVCTVNGTGGASFTCPSNLKCVINCDATNACGNITCSSGSQCDITCSADTACRDITCDGTSCVAKCTVSNACNDINCGGGNNGSCDLQCTATGACNSAKCLDSCKCDTTCSPAGACGTLVCPRAMGNMYCTGTGTQGDPCISSATPICDKC